MAEQIQHGTASNSPGKAWRKVTPSDTDDLPGGPCRALLVGSGGAADILDGTGTACDAVPLQTGWNPGGVQRVKSTNLVASNIWAIY